MRITPFHFGSPYGAGPIRQPLDDDGKHRSVEHPSDQCRKMLPHLFRTPLGHLATKHRQSNHADKSPQGTPSAAPVMRLSAYARRVGHKLKA